MNRQGPAGAGQFIADDDSGETATAAADNFSDTLLRDDDFDFSSDDLFELMWQGGGPGLEQPAAVSCLRLSPAPPPVVAPSPPSPDHHHAYYAAAPSEEEMAAWLYLIVSGGGDSDFAGQLRRSESDDGRREALPEKGSMQTSTEDRRPGELRELIKDTSIDDSGEKKTSAASGAGSRRPPHSAGVHNLTEKRRRFKITEKLKTLQQLVPGCDKSDQASTLDQTILYMKSLQHQVNAMSVVGSGMARQPPTMYPQYLPPPPTMPLPLALGVVLAAGSPPTMAPFGAMLPYPHYPAVLLPPPPALYCPAAAATAPSVARAAGGGSHRRHGSSGGGRCKSSSSQLRQKQ
ncbi:hypothetical protein ABZP36_033608 [Zizania latifolia]